MNLFRKLIIICVVLSALVPVVVGFEFDMELAFITSMVCVITSAMILSLKSGAHFVPR